MSTGNVIPAVGASSDKSVFKARLSGNTTVSQNNPIPFSVTDFSIGSDITSDGSGTFTLKAGKTYRLKGYSRHDGGGINANSVWHNVTDASNFPTVTVMPAANFAGGFSANHVAEEFITPTVDTQVQFRLSSTTSISISGGAGGSYAVIETV